MARYSRSDTAIDSASQFFPQSFLGRGMPRTLRGRMRLSGLGFWDELFPSDISATPGAVVPAYETAPPESGFDWGKLFTGLGEVYIAKEQAELQAELQRINLERARAGQPPLSSDALAARAQVGLTRETQNTILMVALGGAAILGGAYMFGGRGRRARRR